MKESIFKNRAFQTIFKLITALSFTLFTAYQIYLAVNIETNRVGRLIGIVFYLLLTGVSQLFRERQRVDGSFRFDGRGACTAVRYAADEHRNGVRKSELFKTGYSAERGYIHSLTARHARFGCGLYYAESRPNTQTDEDTDKHLDDDCYCAVHLAFHLGMCADD